jgi:hypothetical protein
MVTLHDIDGAASSLKSFLTQSMQAALGYQLTPAEALVIPVPCVPIVTSTHRTGEEATQVTVTVDEVCTGEAYDKSALRTQIVRHLAQQAKDQLGPGYCLSGEVQATIQQVTIMNAMQGTVALKLKAMGVWVYRFSDKQVQNMAGKRLIAEFAEKKGWDPAEWFEEPEQSAVYDVPEQRPVFTRLLNDASTRFQVVLCSASMYWSWYVGSAYASLDHLRQLEVWWATADGRWDINTVWQEGFDMVCVLKCVHTVRRDPR